MALNISKETFKEMSLESKLDVLFEFTSAIYHRMEILEKCVESRKTINAAIALGGGIVGTVSVLLSQYFMWR
jgi:hypothetical protein